MAPPWGWGRQATESMKLLSRWRDAGRGGFSVAARDYSQTRPTSRWECFIKNLCSPTGECGVQTDQNPQGRKSLNDSRDGLAECWAASLRAWLIGHRFPVALTPDENG